MTHHHESPLLPPKPEDMASAIALAAAKEAVRQHDEHLFAALGVNVADAKQLERLRDDLAFLQHLRSGSNRVGLAIVTALAGAVGIGVWEFVKGLFHWH